MTKWQIVLRTAGRELHLGYSARKTKGALFRAMQANADLVLNASGLAKARESEGFEWNTKSQSWQFNGWSVRFSGATEHDHEMMKLMIEKGAASA